MEGSTRRGDPAHHHHHHQQEDDDDDYDEEEKGEDGEFLGVVQVSPHPTHHTPSPRVKIPLSDPQPLRRSGPLGRSSSSLRRSSCLSAGQRPVLRALPLLIDTPPAQRASLFKQKVRQCAVLLDWSSAFLDVEEKEIKRATLKELSTFVKHPTLRGDAFSDPATYGEVFHMVGVNLFRPLTPSQDTAVGPTWDHEDADIIMEDSWPHLRLVYKFLLDFLESPALNVTMAQHAISSIWIIHLLDLFRAGDPRERGYLKTALHRVYGRFLDCRMLIRQHIAYTFYELTNENELHPGIAEILEVLGTIIHGFTLPLKDEHIQFLKKALLPLHKTSTASSYYSQLVYCVYQYLAKQPTLAIAIFEAILRYWPKVNSNKEILFLSEVDELLAICDTEQLTPVIEALLRRLGASMSSQHFQVADKALSLWRKKHFIKIVRQYLPQVISCIYSQLQQNATEHWHKTVRQMSRSLACELARVSPGLTCNNGA